MSDRSPVVGGTPRLALNKTEAAQALGVSVDFFDDHVADELRCVRRGRRRLYPVAELQRWLDEAAQRARLGIMCGPAIKLMCAKTTAAMEAVLNVV